MKRYHWNLLAITLLFLTIACSGRKDVETDMIPAPITAEPAETQPIEEPVTPVVVPEEEPEPLETFDPRQILLDDIHFDFDKSDLLAEARATLDRHARTLRANPNVKVLIEGHCDERGTEEYNIALGERRAERVRSYLESLGVSALRLRTISYGEMRPNDPRHNEDAWATNRRAHFVLSLAE